MSKLLRRLQYLLHRGQAERDLQEEMAAHRELAGKSIGPDLRLREEARDAWGFTMFDELWHDVKYGVRMLWRSPGFTLTAVGVLALGMGANLATFHIFNAALFHRLNVRDADAILSFERSGYFSMPAIEFFRKNGTLFTYLVAEKTDATVFVEDAAEAEKSSFVSPNYFAGLGLVPVRGRLIDQRDADPGAPSVVVLAHAFWQGRFGGDAAVIGRAIRMNGKPVEVVGVAPADFSGLASQQPALWFSIAAHPYLFPGSQVLTDFQQKDSALYALTKPGVSADAGNAQLDSLLAELERQHPGPAGSDGKAPRRQAATGRRMLGVNDDVLVPIAMVTLLTMLVLITACANLGNVLLARGMAREREIGIRVAVGAGAGRIVRQLMAENLLLAVLGSAAGLALGLLAAKTLVSLIHAPLEWSLETDWRMLLVGGGLAVFAAALFGLAPAMQAVRKRDARPNRMRRVLVAVQVGTSCFLLILTAVLARSVQQYMTIETRFDYQRMMIVDPQLYSRSLAGAAALETLQQISTRVQQLPGVAGVTMSVAPPFTNRPAADPNPTIRMNRRQVMPNYFDVMNLPVVRGRVFRADEDGVVVLSETAARGLFPNEDPLGKSLTMANILSVGIETGKLYGRGAGKKRDVIGIVRDSGSASAVNAAEAYLPIAADSMSRALLVVRTDGDPASMLQQVRSSAAVEGLTPTVALMRSNADQRGKMRVITGSVGSLGASATLLAALGLFGLISFAVAQRTREIGVRMALGARPGDVIAVLVEQYTWPMVIGAAIGSLFAGGVSRLMATQFLGLRALDPWAYALSLAGFALIALVAVLIPARRALRIDPAIALRWE